MIANNLQSVRDRITTACFAAGRAPSGVKLLAVSKKFSAQAVLDARAAGQFVYGENYIAEGADKITALKTHKDLEWHCIGPVQSNKTRLVAEHFDWVQSVDRLKIAQRLSEQRPLHLAPIQVCLQVNIDGGSNKSGVTPKELPELVQLVAKLPRICLRGLMMIPEPAINFEAACAVYSSARALFDQINLAGLAPMPLDTLSMGMTADLEAAIASGSTMVRVGTAIFGDRLA